jgi:outer membrane protein assembly factor BamB
VVTDSTVIAAVMGTLRAFDRSTGRTLWSAHADADNVVMAGDTVYYVTCNDPTHDHWLYARSLADGSVRFRATLVDACDSRLAIDARHEIAIDEGHGEQSELSIAFDHAGHELYRLREQIAATHTQDDDLVIVSDKRIARLADTGRVVWSLPAPHDSFVTAAEFAELPDGDLVVATYCAISDNGIELQRIGEDGSVRWHVTVPGLGVQHSEYLQHVYLEIRKQSLFAVSQASGGNFIEQLDLATGAHHAVLRP